MNRRDTTLASNPHTRSPRPVTTKRPVATASAPAAIGPYSQAMIAPPGAELVFCSGQIALVPSTGQLVEGSIGDRTRACLENLRSVLGAAGCSMRDVVKTTIFLTDMETFAEVNAAYGAFFEGEPPARSTIQVAGLPKGTDVEIEAVAIRRGDRG